MPQILDTLAAEVTKATSIMASATTQISGIQGRIQAAVDAALANGATAEELAPIQAEVDALDAQATALATAVQANTPAA